MNGSSTLIIGSSGQLGKALADQYPDAKKPDSSELDITNSQALNNYDWDHIDTLINAAAYTDVDGAETPEGQDIAWEVNDKAVGNLAQIAKDKNLTLVHISTDYVFDGTKKEPYKEDDVPNPSGVYAKTKAAGDQKATQAPKHYILRTSWVIGDGKNFVRTMLELGQKGVSPKVVADQVGRPTFTSELVRAINHLLERKAEFGTYNVTGGGEPVNWADLTREIFKEARFNLNVTDTTTEEYFASKPNVAPRPLNSVLTLSKIEATGFRPKDWKDDLKQYIKKELSA